MCSSRVAALHGLLTHHFSVHSLRPTRSPFSSDPQRGGPYNHSAAATAASSHPPALAPRPLHASLSLKLEPYRKR